VGVISIKLSMSPIPAKPIVEGLLSSLRSAPIPDGYQKRKKKKKNSMIRVDY
jgi:hypothetical protein